MSYPDTKPEIPEGGFEPVPSPKEYPMMQGQEQPCQGYPMPQGHTLVPGQPYQGYPMPQGQLMGHGQSYPGYPIPQGQTNVAYQSLGQNAVMILTGRAGLPLLYGKYAKYLIACRCGLVLGMVGVMFLVTEITNFGGNSGGFFFVFTVLPVICLIASIVLCCYVKKGYNQYKVEAELEQKKKDEMQREQVEQQKEMTEFYRNQNQMFQQQQQQQQQQQEYQQQQQQL